MEEKEVILTQEGYDRLEEELNYLRTEKRSEIAERIVNSGKTAFLERQMPSTYSLRYTAVSPS